MFALRLHACFSVSPFCVGPDKHVVSRSFLSRFTVVKCSMQKRVNWKSDSIGRPVSRVVQRTLGKDASLSVGVDQVGNLVISPGGTLVLCIWISLVVRM